MPGSKQTASSSWSASRSAEATGRIVAASCLSASDLDGEEGGRGGRGEAFHLPVPPSLPSPRHPVSPSPSSPAHRPVRFAFEVAVADGVALVVKLLPLDQGDLRFDFRALG